MLLWSAEKSNSSWTLCPPHHCQFQGNIALLNDTHTYHSGVQYYPLLTCTPLSISKKLFRWPPVNEFIQQECLWLANSWSVTKCRTAFWLHQASQLDILGVLDRIWILDLSHTLTVPRPGGVLSNPALLFFWQLLVRCCNVVVHKQQLGFFKVRSIPVADSCGERHLHPQTSGRQDVTHLTWERVVMEGCKMSLAPSSQQKPAAAELQW